MPRPSLLDGLPDPAALGRELHALCARLYPIPRSITGDGVRQTLGMLGKILPLGIHELPSGTPVLDWTVPKEWNVREAYIADRSGRRIVDMRNSSLHVVGYSTPVRQRLSLAALRPHLHTLPGKPDLIPYRTAYYQPTWGFCLPHRVLEAMPDDDYEVVIDARLEDGAMTWGEAVLPGETADEVLLSAHVCHPALANDNCSGLAALALLGRHLHRLPRRYTYRLLFAPGTIGAIAWLALNRDSAARRIRHGLVVSNVGDGGGPTYKRSRRGNADIDRAAALVLAGSGMATARLLDFAPYGYDERQYCSPGFDLAVGSFQRSAWGTFPEYHTSADNLAFIRPEHLAASLRLIARILDCLERDGRWVNLAPHGEPQLGRRGLYDGADGRPLPEAHRMALLWVLNQSDGSRSLIDIAERSGLAFDAVAAAAQALYSAGLIARARGAAVSDIAPASP